jgi:hypothetical protein
MCLLFRSFHEKVALVEVHMLAVPGEVALYFHTHSGESPLWDSVQIGGRRGVAAIPGPVSLGKPAVLSFSWPGVVGP